MSNRSTFLHLTDAHVSQAGVAFDRDDQKVAIPSIAPGRREDALDQLFARLAENLKEEGRRLDAVIFSGDAQHQGAPGGHELVFELLVRHLGPVGVTPERIVATPGNHDVPRDTPPGSAERYADFRKIWCDAGCVVPWLDGIDPWPLPRDRMGRHRLLASDRSWAIFPMNTSNWSHVSSVLPKPLSDVWDTIPDAVAKGDAERASRLRAQLQSLARYDMARVSERQLETLRAIVADTVAPNRGRQLRIVAMHHHLRSPSLREELKPFADMSNLEQVRALLRDSGMDIVVHGHKHEYATYFDHIYGDDGEEARRTLVVSGATFDVGREKEAMRLLTVEGLPHTPQVTLRPLPLPRAGATWQPGPPTVRRLWVQKSKTGDPVVVVPSTPITIEGSDIDEVYVRACAAANSDASRGTLIVHLDLPDDGGPKLPLPVEYPLPEALRDDERDEWLRDLVNWWQRDRSQLEHRIPYIHGVRLRRYGGKIDQIKRIIDLLKAKESTRAVAVLVDPFRDFNPAPSKEEFASFCLVEFRRRNQAGGATVVDAIAFYRAQEFARWWPVNIAELRLLQREIGEACGFKPGRITTVAADARTIARSPTQVAMPLIDRLLDQAPEKLHLLADAMVRRSVRNEHQKAAVASWREALGELRNAANASYNNDGIPIAIEGLRALAAYVEVGADAGDTKASTIVATLRDLADQNEGYERSKREPEDFKRWSRGALQRVAELEAVTDERTK
ncbi:MULTISPECIES: thymidylate synthase [Bradyrhizobium]|jgi:3',5'-cyclic AMP phosphodiesterase CpdA|uniref:3',5'-cyclic AMP phosphodiesterase CpdA n=1 Tax=Bradyrhizobium elkanii TaxID=29448 RepID=A0A8I1Y6U6_BRAEL|nr:MULTISPECIES: thymidylate synthase [Bradyrhizobium]MBP1294325.1 3',5'-cyclic AMP phosphodiesterase CpdA [Bradyrhizobium elkanii]MCP1925286.1 3',5'-cyclic AMP phosphodiesterase CpdA [Bradyrhizobium elkanii]MCS3477221.1 3',5'-cyclic AMP phosphodiesterase CpdA [Bradyrhizobium elkanii]MCS3583958.1 3',5'-cyclic AMP phosphodiesterase CpdA [Bradyrhizobium elkanii]MCS3717528.1 3',5'-cyclic AMP phosphodiesterase CpdA [Bradyrhizobium elkanii]